MHISNLNGRLVIMTPAGAVDVERASRGQFGADPQDCYDRWDEFTSWGAGVAAAQDAEPFDAALLGAPAPRPRQSFGIGLNYRDHGAESGITGPMQPSVFTKFPTCITGPGGDIELPPGGHTDWEVELVAVIGRAARRVSEATAWSYVAGLTAGQDISERVSQLDGPAPQFSLGKSFPRFGPTGPWLVTVDEFGDPDDLELSCSINGEQVQQDRTRNMIAGVPALIANLSAVLTLLPGDVIFTGTPAGVGLGRNPQRWLAPGDELVTRVEGIGEMRHRFIAKP